MPLDYSIPLQSRLPSFTSPLETFSGLLQLRDAQQQHTIRRMQIEERNRDLADDDAIRTVFQRHLQPDKPPDFDLMTRSLDAFNPRAAMKFRKQVADWQKDKLDTFIKERDATDKALDQSARLMHGVADLVKDPTNQREVAAASTLYGQVAPQVRQLLPAYAEQVPDQYDPAAVGRMLTWGTAAQEHLAELKQAAEDAKRLIDEPTGIANRDLKQKEIAARTLKLADSPEGWTAAKTQLQLMGGIPKQTLDWFGDFSPQNVQRATAFLQSGRAEAKFQQADNMEVLRQGRWVPTPGRFDPDTGEYFEAGSTTALQPGQVRLRPRVSELGILTPGQQATQERFEAGGERSVERRLQDKVDDIETWYSKQVSDWEDSGGSVLADLKPEDRDLLNQQKRRLDAELDARKLRAINNYRTEKKLPTLKTLPPEWKTPKAGSPQSSLIPSTTTPLPSRPLATGQLARAGLPDVREQARAILRQNGRDASDASVAIFLQSPVNARLLNLA